MRKAELVIITISILALLLSVFLNFPGVNTLTILCFLVLYLSYFFLSFILFNNIPFGKIFKKAAYQNVSSLRILGSIATGICLSITILGILFKVMFWPGSSVNLMTGIFGLIIIVIISLIKHSKNKSDFYTSILNRSVIFGGIAFILALIPNTKLAEIKYRNEPEYARVLVNTIIEPDNVEYQKQLQELQSKR